MVKVWRQFGAAEPGKMLCPRKKLENSLLLVPHGVTLCYFVLSVNPKFYK
jgi:hypothetical protein